MPYPRTGRLTQLTRGANLVVKLIKGLFLVGAIMPAVQPHKRDVIIEQWCREVLEALSIRLVFQGERPPEKVSSVLFVANHVSWMDILVINACRRAHFVAKAEVRQWPLVGWMAARTGTLFLKRTSLHELARVTQGVTASLRRGQCVALFPEGTTTDGASLRTFHSGLFESAIDAEALVWPVAIQYRGQDGRHDADIAFVGDQTLVASIRTVLTRPTTQARLSFAPPMESSAGNRRELTAWSRQAIERGLAGRSPLAPPSPLSTQEDDTFPPLSAA
jgi:1-acyl-sn-glycerol-3-phosphate acyltransferase